MNKMIVIALLSTASITASPAYANNQEKEGEIQNLNDTITKETPVTNTTDIDRIDINAGFDAIRKKAPQIALNKADAIIKRFEANKKDNANYTCTSGQTDTLNSLLGAALIAGQGEQTEGKTSTHAISYDICDAYFLKGFALIDLKKRNEALPSLQTAVKMDPDNTQYINELAEWYKGSRDWETSLSLFTKASETTDLSIEFMEDKKLSEKILDTRRCRSYRGIAFNHAEMKNWKKARKAAKACLKLIPNDPGSLGELKYIEANEGKK